MAGPLVPHRGISAWARPLDNNEGTETKRRVRRAAAPSAYPLGGMLPRPGTPSYEDTTIDEQGTEWSSFPPHTAARWDTTQHGTAQHSTTRHNTTQHSTAQHNTIQRSTAQHGPWTTPPTTIRGSEAMQRPPPKGERAPAPPPPQEHPQRQGGRGAARQDGRSPLRDERQGPPPRPQARRWDQV